MTATMTAKCRFCGGQISTYRKWVSPDVRERPEEVSVVEELLGSWVEGHGKYLWEPSNFGWMHDEVGPRGEIALFGLCVERSKQNLLPEPEEEIDLVLRFSVRVPLSSTKQGETEEVYGVPDFIDEIVADELNWNGEESAKGELAGLTTELVNIKAGVAGGVWDARAAQERIALKLAQYFVREELDDLYNLQTLAMDAVTPGELEVEEGNS